MQEGTSLVWRKTGEDRGRQGKTVIRISLLNIDYLYGQGKGPGNEVGLLERSAENMSECRN